MMADEDVQACTQGTWSTRTDETGPLAASDQQARPPSSPKVPNGVGVQEPQDREKMSGGRGVEGVQDREAAAQSHVEVKSTELASKSAELVKSSEEDLRLAAEKAALEGELAGLCAQIKADASAGAELGEAVGTIAGVQAHENECAMRPGKDLETLAGREARAARRGCRCPKPLNPNLQIPKPKPRAGCAARRGCRCPKP